MCRLLRRENIKVCAVPDVAAAAKQNSAKAMKQGSRQCTNEVLMVAPTAFGFNDQTAQDNSFMHASREGGSTEAGSDVTHHVLREFSGLYRELTEVGILLAITCDEPLTSVMYLCISTASSVCFR